MITILHGDNIVASRKKLDDFKEKFSGEIITLDGKALTQNEFIQATQSNSLFEQKKLVIVEGFLNTKKKMDLDLKDLNLDVIFWEDKEVPKTILENFPSAKLELFKAPQIIWKFLDSMTIPLFREAAKTNDIQFIFLMLVRKYRLENNGEKLKQLLELDYKFKQGLLVTDFTTALELFILDI